MFTYIYIYIYIRLHKHPYMHVSCCPLLPRLLLQSNVSTFQQNCLAMTLQSVCINHGFESHADDNFTRISLSTTNVCFLRHPLNICNTGYENKAQKEPALLSPTRWVSLLTLQHNITRKARRAQSEVRSCRFYICITCSFDGFDATVLSILATLLLISNKKKLFIIPGYYG